ncbi:MAG: hypothetical protein LBS61_02515 [Endomicrobium sp.]|nr:hypothetical protein [Endomicrobium sp.]
METEVINGLLTLKINMIQAVALSVIMYYFGIFLRSKIRFFVKLSIPASAIGGLSIAIVAAFLQYNHILKVQFDSTLQNLLMIMFFCTIGMNATYKLLMNGGLMIVAFLSVCSFLAVLQNVAGVCIAKIFNLNPLLGIVGGSMSMAGGLGTAGTFGSFFENTLGVNSAATAGIACATFGMVAGSAVGGPLAEWIIKRHKVITPRAELNDQAEIDTESQSSEYEEVGDFAQEEGVIPTPSYEEEEDVVSGPRLMRNLAWLLTAMGIGSVLSFYFGKAGIVLPSYLVTMIAAVVIRNIGDVTKIFELDTKTVGMISDVSLAIFVTMAISSLKLCRLMDLALPIIAMLVIQIILVLLVAYFFVYKLLGKNYNSTVMAAGFAGFGLGAMPNALSNMQVVTKEHGYSMKAFLVVPIVGCFLVDFTNAILITFFANILR